MMTDVKPTRRAVVGGLASLSTSVALPGIVRSAKGLPTQGVSFVEAGSADAESLAVQYNLVYNRAPRLRAVCQTVDGAMQTVRWARDNAIDFAVRSGGHCYAGTGYHPDLVIDVRELNAVSVDPAANRVTAQAGAKLGALYRSAFPHGLAPAAGWCADVGLGGHVLGGGLGYLARANGLLCDNLTAVRMIDAQGDLVRCTPDENADLFWACRGGGGGLGLVTECEIDLQPVGDIHSIRVFGGLPLTDAPALVSRWMAWSLNAPRETSSQLGLSPLSDGRMFITITGLSSEPEDQLRQSLQAVTDGHLSVDDDSLLSGAFERVMEDTVFSIPHFYLHSAFHTAVLGDVMTADQLAPIIEKSKESRTNTGGVSFLIEAMGGAIGDSASDATAFPYRDGAFVMTASYGTISDELLQAAAPELDAIGNLMWDHAIGRGYVNYRDRTLDDYETAYWGGNVGRLRAIKRRVDPDGVFNGIQTIQP